MNIIDIRDIIEEYEQLEATIDTADEDGTERLATLKSLLDELAGCGGDEQWRGDWYPVTLIDVDDFEDYAQELAEDCGLIKNATAWPLTCIDWKKAARELAYDYSQVDFDGESYYYR